MHDQHRVSEFQTGVIASRARMICHAIAVLTLLQMILGLLRGFFPYDLDQSTLGFMVSDLLLNHQNPWSLKSVINEPYCIPTYGVIYHFIFAFGQLLFKQQYYFMRLISLISNITICLMVYKLASREFQYPLNIPDKHGEKFKNLGGKIALFLILCSSAFISNISNGRPDNLGIAVSMAGIFLLVNYRKGISPQWVPCLSGFLAGSGPLIKQSFISAFLFGMLLAWKQGCLKKYCLFAIGFPAIVCSILIWMTDGDFITICISFPGMPEKTISNIIAVFRETFFTSITHFSILFGVIGFNFKYLSNYMSNKLISKNPSFQMIPWIIISAFLSLFTSSRTLGGNPIYWLEFLIISSVFVGNHLANTIRISSVSKSLNVVAIILFLMIAGSGLVFSLRSLRGVYFEWSAIPYYRELQLIVIENTPPNEPVVGYYSNIGISAGRRELFNDLLMYQYTTSENRNLLKSAIASGKISCLLLQPQYTANYLTSDYIEIPTSNPFPNRVFAVKLFMRKNLLPVGTD